MKPQLQEQWKGIQKRIMQQNDLRVRITNRVDSAQLYENRIKERKKRKKRNGNNWSKA